MKKIIKIVWACVVIFMAMATVGFFPSISSLLALAFILIILPIDRLQEFYRSFKLTGIVKAAVLVVLFIGTVILAPVTDTEENTVENGENKTEFVEPAKPEEPENKTDSTQLPEEPAFEQEVPNDTTENTSAEKPEVNSKPVENPGPTLEPVPEPEPEPVTPSESSADPEKAFRDSIMQYNYVGSSESDKYHKPTCRWTANIHDGNLVHFDTEEEAKQAGYSPCGTCKP